MAPELDRKCFALRLRMRTLKAFSDQVYATFIKGGEVEYDPMADIDTDPLWIACVRANDAYGKARLAYRQYRKSKWTQPYEHDSEVRYNQHQEMEMAA